VGLKFGYNQGPRLAPAEDLLSGRERIPNMSHRFICLALLFGWVMLDACEVDAQIVQRIRERRAAMAATLDDPNAAAATAPGDAAAVPPVPAPLPMRGGFIARRLQQRRDLVAQQAAAQPTPAASPGTPPLPPQQQTAQRPQISGPASRGKPQGVGPQRAMQALQQASALAAPALEMLNPNDVTAMEVPDLQTALSNTSGALGNELARFSSAASWQEFFALPGSIVDEGTIDLAALQTALVRFENVAANPKFAQIAELPSFDQARSLLTELVNRVDVPTTEDGPQLIDPAGNTELSAEAETANESLPAPQPQLPRNEGEHSILVRTNKS
jgi:hypothetical protein